MHGHVNPTLPVVAELVRRGHSVTYHTSPAFREEIEATGATVCLYPGGDQPLPDPPMPVTLMEGLARHRRPLAARCAHRPARRPARPDRPRHRLFVGRGRRPRTRRAGGVVVHHVRVQPACAQPHPRLVGPAGRGGDSAQQPPGLPAVALGAAPPLRHAWVATARLGEHPPAAQPGLHLAGVPACRRGLRPVLPVRRPEHRRPPGRPVVPGRSAAGPGAVRLAGHGVQRRSAAAAQLRHRARPAGRHRDRLHRTDRSRRAGSAAGQRARPPLRAATGGAGPRGAVRHPWRDEQRQRGHVRRGSDAGGPAGRRPADGGPSRRRARRRPVDPYRGRHRGAPCAPSPGVCSTTHGSGQPRPPCRSPSTRRVDFGAPPTNSSGTCRRPARSVSRLRSIRHSEAERCHPSSSSCCCSPGCRRPPAASCLWWRAGPACRGPSWPGCC